MSSAHEMSSHPKIKQQNAEIAMNPLNNAEKNSQLKTANLAEIQRLNYQTSSPQKNLQNLCKNGGECVEGV